MTVFFKSLKPSMMVGHHNRFWEKVRKGLDCWEWTSSKNYGGYGTFCLGKTTFLAHRIAYTILIGKIPSAMCVLHTCDNRSCVNPDHLWIGTYADNYHDMAAKGRVSAANQTCGEDHPNAKLTTKQVIAIRSSSENQYLIAERLGVSQSIISDIKSRKTWRHV